MASGNQLAAVGAQQNSPPSSSFAVFDVNNDRLVLSFAPTADEAAFFLLRLPGHYSGGGITVSIVFTTPAGGSTTGNQVWGATFKRLQDDTDNMGSTGFATEKTVTSAAPGTAEVVQYATITFSDGSEIDNIAVNEAFLLRIRRLGADAGDTNSAAGLFISGQMRET